MWHFRRGLTWRWAGYQGVRPVLPGGGSPVLLPPPSHSHHIPSRPLLLPPLHTCVYVRTRGHIHTHKPTHALATTSAAPSQWLGELNLPGTHAFSPILANLRHGGGEIGTSIA